MLWLYFIHKRNNYKAFQPAYLQHCSLTACTSVHSYSLLVPRSDAFSKAQLLLSFLVFPANTSYANGNFFLTSPLSPLHITDISPMVKPYLSRIKAIAKSW